MEPIEEIQERISDLGHSKEELASHLENMAKKGAIMRIVKEDSFTYGNALLVVGMFEFQVNKLTEGFIKDMHKYFYEAFLWDMAKVPIPQLRTIPVGVTIDHEAEILNYDNVNQLIEKAEGPYVLINCVCRQGMDLLNKPCKATSRREVCMGFGESAKAYIDAGWGREITRNEAIEVLKQNEEEGLVLQPSNSINAEFICSCCGCCCEGLSSYKRLPNPADIVASNYFAVVDEDACTGCRTCEERCQMAAITVDDIAIVNLQRCIGCGACVKSCPSEAIKLEKKANTKAPPETMVELYENIAKMKAKVKKMEERRQKRKEK